MSPTKVMPLLLTVITPLVITAGLARAAETPIVLAQAYTPQQKEDEKHKQQQQQQHGQQQQQQQQHVPPQPHPNQVQQQPQQRLLEQQHGQQKALEEHKALDLKAREAADAKKRAEDAAKLHADRLKIQQQKALELQHGQQQKLLEEKHKEDAAKLHNDQLKIQQQQQQLHHTEQQLHQEHQQLNTMHHELSAGDQKAKLARDAHQADRTRLLEKQKQMAAQEKSPAAVSERLRLQNERLHAITSQRHETMDQHGQKVITEPGNRTILQANGHAFIHHDETANFKAFGGTPLTRRGPNGNSISTIAKPDGSRIEIEVDSYGRPIRRVRYMPDGRRFVLFENRAIAVGVGLALGAIIVSLPPVHYDIPPEQYIVDADVASEDDIYGALQAGPVVPLDRGYSLEEVLASVSLRERMRSISIDTINFDFGSWEVGPDQAVMLESVAAAIRDMTAQNPGEVFLIEGHTDAVGSDIDNLSLSDRRAQAVADVLSQQFNIPRENLVTQGYGKQFLLIPTPEPERRNRRVVIRRITPLLQTGEEHYSASEGGPEDQGPR